MNSIELLAPAGDYEKLLTAYDYGADAAYIGSERYGLRAMAGNFGDEDLARARELADARGKKLYLTLNAYLTTEHFDGLAMQIERLRPLDLDAYIVSDPGVLELVRRLDPGRSVHLSTQANTTNAEAASFWQRNGVTRVNLARELTLEQIRSFGRLPGLELETFVHGAMCVAYSGRCLLSAAMTGRSANAGACSHPCRWRYALVEESRPDQLFPVEEDRHGTYVMNSRDLCLVEYLPRLIEAGVDCLKIEGRMKSRYYVAAVTRVYREAIDRYLADPPGWQCAPRWLEELDKVSHRPYGPGFLFGHDDVNVHPADSEYRRTYDFVGQVIAVEGDGVGLVEGKNRFFPEETLELIGPHMRQARFQVPEVATEDGTPLDVVQPNARVRMRLPAGSRPGDFLRREKQGKP